MRRFVVLGALASSTAPAWAQGERARTVVQPYIEGATIVAADLGGDDVVTYTTLSAGVDASIATRRAEGQVGYRFDYLLPWDEGSGGVVHSGLARGSFLLAPGLSVEGGAIATRSRVDARGGAPALLLGDEVDNVAQVYSLYAGPTLSRQVGVGRLDAGYRVGYTKAETPGGVSLGPSLRRRDYYDDATNHIATARYSVAPRAVLPVGLAASAAYEREDAGQLGARYEGYLLRGDLLAPVSATVALAGGVGYETIEASSRRPLLDGEGAPDVDVDGRFVSDPAQGRRVDYRTDGLYYDVGVVWRPNRRTQLMASVGERYGSFTGFGSLSYQASASVGVAVNVYDSVQTFGRQLRNGLANLPTSFVTARDQFAQQYNGCVFGTSGRTPGGCLNAVFQSINTVSYRARGVDAVVSATRGPHNFGAGVGYANRRLNAADDLPAGVGVIGLEDESAYAQLFYARGLSPVSGFDAQAFLNYYRTVGSAADGLLWGGAVASYYRQFGRLSARASLGLFGFDADQQSNGDGDNWTAQALLGARYTF